LRHPRRVDHDAQTADKSKRDVARQECIRNGGWYHAGSQVCEYELKAKAATIENDRTDCQPNGGWFHPDSGICELELKGRARK
jgi:hypothetical protein